MIMCSLVAGLVLYFFVFVTVQTPLSTASCVTGCKCSRTNDAAECCLLPLDGYSNPRGYKSDEPIADVCPWISAYSQPEWPSSVSCLPSWQQLQIKLIRGSWPTIRRPLLRISNSCTEHLERLVINGASSGDDGLIKLHPAELRNLFFQTTGGLALLCLTVQQTRLTAIGDGFLDELQATRLTDLEIRRNPQLTDSGLGVGWLANAPNLRHVDLSRNSLTSVDFARWGFALSKPSDLATLNLAGNEIAHLKPGTFSRVPRLVSLDLSDNSLASLNLAVFKGLTNLKILDLKGNRLTLPGLKPYPSNLLFTLPSLQQLKLSGNQLLLSDSNETSWWLTDRCPKQLTQIYLESLMSRQIVPTSSQLMLPPIAWDLCPSVNQVILADNPFLPCLPQRWLYLRSDEVSIPPKFRIMPSTLQLCPPSTFSVDSSKHRDAGGHTAPKNTVTPYPVNGDTVVVIEPSTVPFRKTHVSVSSSHQWMNSPNGDSPIEANQNRNLRILRLRDSTISPWVVFALVIFLLLIILSLIVWTGVYCVRHYRHRLKLPGLRLSQNQFDPRTAKYTAVPAYSDPFAAYSVCSVPQSKLDQPFYSSIGLIAANDNPSYQPYAFIPPTRTSMRLLSPTDSGLEDITPITLQQSFRSAPSRSSSRQSVRLSKHPSQFPHRIFVQSPLSYAPSFTSLRSANLPSRRNNAYMLCQSYFASPQKTMNVGTSTEDISTGPSSTLLDLGDECGTLSERSDFPNSNGNGTRSTLTPEVVYKMSIGQIFHTLSLEGDSITLTNYRLRRTEEPVQWEYSYALQVPDAEAFLSLKTVFTDEGTTALNWSYLDNYLCTRGVSDSFVLLPTLKFWRSRFLLVPNYTNETKRLSEAIKESLHTNGPRVRCDVYEADYCAMDQAKICEKFVHFIESISRVRRCPARKMPLRQMRPSASQESLPSFGSSRFHPCTKRPSLRSSVPVLKKALFGNELSSDTLFSVDPRSSAWLLAIQSVFANLCVRSSETKLPTGARGRSNSGRSDLTCADFPYPSRWSKRAHSLWPTTDRSESAYRSRDVSGFVSATPGLTGAPSTEALSNAPKSRLTDVSSHSSFTVSSSVSSNPISNMIFQRLLNNSAQSTAQSGTSFETPLSTVHTSASPFPADDTQPGTTFTIISDSPVHSADNVLGGGQSGGTANVGAHGSSTGVAGLINSATTPVSSVALLMMDADIGLPFVTSSTTGAFPEHTFLSFDAVVWVMKWISDITTVQAAVDYLQMLLESGWIRHTSGNQAHRFVFGCYFYTLLAPDLKAYGLSDTSSPVILGSDSAQTIPPTPTFVTVPGVTVGGNVLSMQLPGAAIGSTTSQSAISLNTLNVKNKSCDSPASGTLVTQPAVVQPIPFPESFQPKATPGPTGWTLDFQTEWAGVTTAHQAFMGYAHPLSCSPSSLLYPKSADERNLSTTEAEVCLSASVDGFLTYATISSVCGVHGKMGYQETGEGVLRKSCICDLEGSTVDDRAEWAHFVYDANYHPHCAFTLELQWLVASGAKLSDLVTQWRHRATNSNFHFFPVPCFPFGHSSTVRSDADPLRAPLFIPINVQSLVRLVPGDVNPSVSTNQTLRSSCTLSSPFHCSSESESKTEVDWHVPDVIHALFAEFPRSCRITLLRMFQDYLLRRFGFLRDVYNSSQMNFELEGLHGVDPTQQNKRWAYVHCSGGMFIMIPSYRTEHAQATSTNSERSLLTTSDTASPSPVENTSRASDTATSLLSASLRSQKPYDQRSLGGKPDGCFCARLEPGYYWSWNHMLPRRWRGYLTGDESFQDAVLADLRAFMRGDDERLAQAFVHFSTTMRTALQTSGTPEGNSQQGLIPKTDNS